MAKNENAKAKGQNSMAKNDILILKIRLDYERIDLKTALLFCVPVKN